MNVLVTGASRGVGRATALALSADHDVAVNYRESAEAAADVAAAAADNGATTTTVRADVTDPEAVESMVEQVVADLGGLDAVVNNAGIVAPDRLTDIDDDQWRRVIETNLSGGFYVTRAAIDHLDPGATSSSSPPSGVPPGPSTPATPRARPVSTG